MTKTIDNLLVKLSFDRQELERIRTRPALYAGIMISVIFLATFLTIVVMG